MCSPCRDFLWLVAIWIASLLTGCVESLPASSDQQPQRLIRICADPDNLPFTNDKEAGFENKIAEMIAADLHAKVQYLWQAQRTGFFRGPLTETQFDLVLGVPYEAGRTTEPYYRSSYVFVSRKDDKLDLRSYDDPRLRTLKIGVQMVGDDYADTPPMYALARSGIIENVVRVSAAGNSVASRMAAALASRDIDVAIIWGPIAGNLARSGSSGISISVPNESRPRGIPIAFNMAMRVTKGNDALRDEINASLSRNRESIKRILDSYGVPNIPMRDSQ